MSSAPEAFETEGEPMSSEPGGRAPVPGRLRLLQQFLNTNDIEGRADELATREDLASWLADRGFRVDEGRIDAAAVTRAIEVREALRTLIVAKDEGGDAHDARRRLREAASRAEFVLTLEPRRWQLESKRRDLDGAVGTMLALVVDAMADGTWGRLKACHRDVCRWVFWDASRSRSGSWCDMSICGNRMKSARFRERLNEARTP
jgi:predicted RNA-binding Zn ribbon-like protein